MHKFIPSEDPQAVRERDLTERRGDERPVDAKETKATLLWTQEPPDWLFEDDEDSF